MKTKEDKNYLNSQLLATVRVLIESSEKDIVHDYGSMEDFYNVIIDRVEELKTLNK